MGMMPLAVGLSRVGHLVTGEDDGLAWRTAKLLQKNRVNILSFGDLASNEYPECIVYSSAISETHPTRIIAKELGIRCVPRGLFLAEYAQDKKLIAICGSHGKTSAAALCAHLLLESGQQADYYVGAHIQGDRFLPGRLEDNTALFAELDESDGTIEAFTPDVLCVLNVDWDHASLYKSEADYREAFYALARRTQSTVLIPRSEMDAFSNALGGSAKLVPVDEEMPFSEYNRSVARTLLKNVFPSVEPPSLETFPGVARRQERLWASGSSSVWQDYAHHPVEIEALLNWFRDTQPSSMVEVIFEPHRHSRTEHLAEEFLEALSLADSVRLLPVYSAGETGYAQPSSIYDKWQKTLGERCAFFESASSLFTSLRAESSVPKNTIRLFVGAGSIGLLAEAYGHFLSGPAAGFGSQVSEVVGADSVRIDESLSGKTTMRVGGVAEVYVEPENIHALRWTLVLAKLWAEPVFFLGKGSNLIVSDSGIQGCVVRLNKDAWQRVEQVEDGVLQVGAGVRLRDICKEAEKSGMGGFEFMEGIPASLGGALRMNAGAMGGWMSDIIDSIEVMRMDGRIECLSHDDLHYGYRSIHELKDRVVLSARLKASEAADSARVKERILGNMQKRKASQPREASAGCMFKNPDGDHAGRLIDACGLKGYRIGDAQVSRAHANFIVNLGSASSSDIVALVNHIRETVWERTGTLLEPEAILVGAPWEAVLEQ